MNVDEKSKRIKARVLEIFSLSRSTYGWRRMTQALKKEGINCNHKKVRLLMKALNLKARVRKKFKATTNSNHGLPVASNLLERRFNTEKPDMAYVGDITYIWTEEGWLYLATVIDLCTRKVKGWSMGERMTADLVISALEMAVKPLKVTENIMFHSDRGSQYASNAFRSCIQQYKMIHSMSRKGNCWDNAVAESFFGTLKQELIFHCRYKTRKEAKLSIFEYISVFYNRIRLHSTLNYHSPETMELKLLAA